MAKSFVPGGHITAGQSDYGDVIGWAPSPAGWVTYHPYGCFSDFAADGCWFQMDQEEAEGCVSAQQGRIARAEGTPL